MCCSREHYPPDVGIWRSDAQAVHFHEGFEEGSFIVGEEPACQGEEDHWHIVRPQGGLVCLSLSNIQTTVAFRINQTPVGNYYAAPEQCKRARELVALVACEGRTINITSIKNVLDEIGGGIFKPTSMLYPSTLEDTLSYTPSYEEWLAAQSINEAKRLMPILTVRSTSIST